MPHLFIRKAIALLCLLLLTILIAGCSPSIEQVIRNHDSFPLHKALAFAKDFSGSWVYGQSWKSTTEEGAAAAALARCDIERLNRNILSRCEIYSVDGRIVVGGHYPKPVTTAESLYPPPESKPQPTPAPSAKNILLTGTGFAVTDDGYLLTANHVVDDANMVTVRLADGLELEAKVVKASRNMDLALLKIDRRTPDYLPVAATQPNVASGDRVFTFGFPVVAVLGAEPKFTDGAISSMSGPGGEITFLQITVPVQAGNSGGPLVSEQGDVVGIITASAAIVPFIKASGTLPQNVNWAVNAIFAAPLVPKVTAQKQMPIKRKDIIERARKSVVLIQALKADPG